jgi:hypothetical protein
MKASFSDLRPLLAPLATTLEPRVVHTDENSGLSLSLETVLEHRIDFVPSNNTWPQYSWRPGTTDARDSRDNGHTLHSHPGIVITEEQAEAIDHICWRGDGPLTASVNLERGHYEARRRTSALVKIKVVDGQAEHEWEVSEDCDDETPTSISPNGVDRIWKAELHQTEGSFELRCLSSTGRVLAHFALPFAQSAVVKPAEL